MMEGCVGSITMDVWESPERQLWILAVITGTWQSTEEEQRESEQEKFH